MLMQRMCGFKRVVLLGYSETNFLSGVFESGYCLPDVLDRDLPLVTLSFASCRVAVVPFKFDFVSFDVLFTFFILEVEINLDCVTEVEVFHRN